MTSEDQAICASYGDHYDFRQDTDSDQ
jgi:hypothetical protein